MANRLSGERSPYLLQHAHNPVDWYPWGAEALERAKAEGRPILLSIGYSACHWCHVMERESFEDRATADAMNASFVNIKVDREERPDVDQVYMRAVQAMTGQGGWPLTVFLTPDAEPYYGGTYFPPVPRQGMPSFRQVLEAAAKAWTERPDEVHAGAVKLCDALRSGQDGVGSAGEVPGAALLDQALGVMRRQYDPRNGGFGGAPKFPQPVNLEVLLRHHARTGDPEALEMAVHTLRRMAAGGLRDHLAGGFHRYTVDARWRVPHFEKMLYDNALLARAYLDAYRLTGHGDLLAVAEQTLDYLLDDLRDPSGGFYTARDADSEGEEGRYYLWSHEEVAATLAERDARVFSRAYDVTTGGNFESRNILWLPHPVEALAEGVAMEVSEVHATLVRARTALLETRQRRIAPARDEKVLAGWNGMALRALAEAGGVLGRADYLDAARKCASFILEAMRLDGRLLHTWKDGQAAVPGFLEDHAALGNGLLSLHESTLERRWLDEARWCCEQVLSRFWDEAGGLFHDDDDAEQHLFMRPRDPMDNATPSGNSLAAELLARAGHLFGNARYTDVAQRTVAREADTMARFPTAFGRLLSVADRLDAEPVELAVVGRPDDPATMALVRAGLTGFHRNRTVVGRAPDDPLDEGIPLLEGRNPSAGEATAWLCRRYACRAPTTDPTELVAELAHPPSM